MEIEHPVQHKKEKAMDTGNWRNHYPVVDESKCIACGNCVKYCPEACIFLDDSEKAEASKSGKVAKIDLEFCKGCGVCAQVCPVNAISMRTEEGGNNNETKSKKDKEKTN